MFKKQKKINLDDPVYSTRETIIIWEYLLKYGTGIEHFFDRIDLPREKLLDPNQWINIHTSTQVMASYRACLPDYDMTQAYAVAVEQFDSYAYGFTSAFFRLPSLQWVVKAISFLSAIPSKIDFFRILESNSESALVEYSVYPGFEPFIDSAHLYMWQGVFSALPKVHHAPLARVDILASFIDIFKRFRQDFKQFNHRIEEKNGILYLDGEKAGRWIVVKPGIELHPGVHKHLDGQKCVLWEKDVVVAGSSGKTIAIARKGELYNCSKAIYHIQWQNIPFPKRLKNFLFFLRRYFPSKIASKKALTEQTKLLYEYSELLKQKVEEKTNEVYQAQQNIHKLEKRVMEHRITGGFAHEMRNALAGAQLEVKAAMHYRNSPVSAPEEIQDTVSRLAKRLASLSQGSDDSLKKHLGESLNELREINQAASHLADILSGISHDIDRGLSITTKIHEYSKIHEIRPGKKQVDIIPLLKNFSREYQIEFKKSRTNYKVQGPEHLILSSDETHLISIFSNLILNAADALAESKTKMPQIIVAVEEKESCIEIRIQDNGPGMSQAVLKKIFHPFFSTKPASGTGLGLGVTRRLLTLYDASINVWSRKGEGTVFTLTWPTQQKEAP